MLRKQIFALLLPALAAGQLALAQTGAQAVQNLRWPTVDLNVLVVDKAGQPQAGLDQATFYVFESGQERPIESISAGDAPVSLALLIDTSGSTYGNRETIATVTTALIRSLPPGSEVMAVLFSDKAFIDLPFTPADPAPLKFLEHLEARGPTAFYDALVATEDYIAAKARNPKRALVVMSDGDDNDSTLNLAQALHRIQEEPGAPTIYFTEMPDSRAKGMEKRHSRSVARLVVTECGGLAVVPDKTEDAAALSARIAALVRSQYVVTFTADSANADGKFRKLEVRAGGANLETHATAGYFAVGK